MSQEKANIKALYGNFVFIGTPVIANSPRFKSYTEGVSDSGYVYSRMQLGIKTSENNVVFTELMGGYFNATSGKNSVIYTMDSNNQKMEVDWRDRFDKNIISKVANYRKTRLELTEGENAEFISTYDAVEYINANINKDARYVVTGNVNIEKYTNAEGRQVSLVKYIINSIRLAKDSDENKAEATLSFVFNKESWDGGRLKDDKKVDVLGYFTTYDRDLKANVFVPVGLVLNCDKLDFDNPVHKKAFDFYKNCFNVKRDKYMLTQWHCTVVNGSEVEEVTADDFTPEQKIQIELGIATEEQILNDMRRGKTGDRVQEIRLVRPTNNFDNSVNEETEYTDDDFIVKEAPPKEGSLDKAMSKTETKDTEKILDNLFG